MKRTAGGSARRSHGSIKPLESSAALDAAVVLRTRTLFATTLKGRENDI